MAKFFIQNEDFKGEFAFIRGTDAHHLQNVLRKSKGDSLEIAALGQSYMAEIAALAPDEVKLRVGEALAEDKESALKVFLLLGISKGEKMDWIIEKATELGVYAIIPIMFSRCVVRLDAAAAAKKQERWQRLAEAASKQCRRSHIPQVFVPMHLEKALGQVQAMPVITLWEDEQQCGYKQALREINASSLALMIGAEGGISHEEIDLMRKQAGARTVSCGKRILRAETAAITALAMCMYELGDLGGGND